jgi:hypothetical protein
MNRLETHELSINDSSRRLEQAQAISALTSAIIFALAVFGYPIIGNLVDLLGVESRVLSIPFRVFLGSLSVLVIALCASIRFDKWYFLMLLIWFALILRLGFDTSIASIENADYALEFFLISCVLPVLAIWALDSYNQKYYATIGFVLASTGSLTALIGNYYGIFGVSSLTELTGRLSSTALNPVSLGHLALSGFLCGLTLLRSEPRWIRTPIMLIMMALVLVIIQTGSKGPVIALLIILFIWASQRGLIVIMIGLILSAVISLWVYGDSTFVQRLMAIDDDPSTIERIRFIQDSLQQIATSPWIGSASVELKSGTYPHNIFLESALSFGLPLTTVLLTLLFYGFVKSYRLLKTENDLVSLLFFQSLIISQISGALFADSLLWICLVLILGLEASNNEKGLVQS